MPTQFIDRDDIPMSTSPAPAGHAKIKVDGVRGVLEWKGGDGVVYVVAAYSTPGTVTQLTSKATTVVLNALSGDITMHAANLAAATIVSFTLTNSKIGVNDLVSVSHVSGGTLGAYGVTATPAAGSATIYVRNMTAGGLAEAIVLRFVVTKGAA